jgi:hypothetical protein
VVPDSSSEEFRGPYSGMAALIGRRNIAYVVFVSLLVPFGMLMEAAGPQGPIPVAGSWPR